MLLKRVSLAFASILVLGFISATRAQTHDEAPHFATTEVGPGLYMLSGVGGFTGGNIGVSVGKDGVVVIDDSMPPFLPQLTAALAALTDRPIDFLINTHLHGDHIGNNAAFANTGALIVSHETLRSRLLNQSTADKPTDPASVPVMTFSKEMSFYLNDQPAHLIHVAAAHTDGDSIIHFPQANVIHTGDAFFHGLFPFIDLDSGGSVAGFIAAQKHLLTLANDDTKIIPGHGGLATKLDLVHDLAMLEDAQALVQALIGQGHSTAEIVAANPLAKYHDDYNWGFITTERMTRTLCRELGAE
jgi:cyclase